MVQVEGAGLESVYDFARPEMIPFVPASAQTVLDVGCSTGRFGQTLRERGQTVIGLEPNARAAELARQRLDSVVVGTFPEALDEVFRPGGYDVIVFNDVLEHMASPEAALDGARGLLAPGGAVVASIPNIRHVTALGPLLVRDAWNYQETGVLDRTHLRFFTGSSAKAFFEEHDWQVICIHGINRCRRAEHGETSTVRRLSVLTGRRLDPFLFLQYALVARPRPA